MCSITRYLCEVLCLGLDWEMSSELARNEKPVSTPFGLWQPKDLRAMNNRHAPKTSLGQQGSLPDISGAGTVDSSRLWTYRVAEDASNARE